MHHVNHQTTTRGKPASAHYKLQSCWDNDSQVLCDIMALTTERERFCLMIRYLSTCDDTWYPLYLQWLEPTVMTTGLCVLCSCYGCEELVSFGCSAGTVTHRAPDCGCWLGCQEGNAPPKKECEAALRGKTLSGHIMFSYRRNSIKLLDHDHQYLSFYMINLVQCCSRLDKRRDYNHKPAVCNN